MATDPFYAGYDIDAHGGEYLLPHVDPFLTKERFLQIQKQIAPIKDAYELHVTELKKLYTRLPRCGYCLKDLEPRLSQERTSAFISCSSGHKRVRYDVQIINAAAEEVIKQVIERLEADKLINDSTKKMKEIQKLLQEEMSKTEKNIQQVTDEILFASNEKEIYNENWEENERYQKIKKLRESYITVEDELNRKHQMLIENQQLYQLTIEAIKSQAEMNINALASLLIREVRLFTEKIEIDVNKWDYVSDFNGEVILHQEVIS